MRPLRAHNAKQGKRKKNEETSSPKTQEQMHAADTPNISHKMPFGERKWLPKSIPGPFVSLWAPGFLQDRPQDASKSALGSVRGAKKTLDAPKGAPSEFPNHFLPFSKPNPPPSGGGTPCSAPAFWLPFLENRCWRLGGGQKSRVQGLRGHSPGLGGEAKASPTTSFAKLVV